MITVAVWVTQLTLVCLSAVHTEVLGLTLDALLPQTVVATALVTAIPEYHAPLGVLVVMCDHAIRATFWQQGERQLDSLHLNITVDMSLSLNCCRTYAIKQFHVHV